jgi:hypothetical protein
MGNNIKQYAIGEILDGRYFYIPAYQRGYRWTEKQVGDLLRDLLCFANDSKSDEDFYCLQPIIACPITEEKKLKELFKSVYDKNLLEKGVWEIIDGQQRLTTIFLLYKYLIAKKGWNAETLKEEEDGKELYHIFYATREDSATFLESLNLDIVKDGDDFKSNIDFYHMASAFKLIDSWIKNEGKEINQRYKLGGSLETVRSSFFALLNGMRDTKSGSVQVLWYELSENRSQSSIKEFQKINTGKIRLTDAELIKGLFLLNRNFEQSSKYIRQSTLAIEWEFIENTLHANNFWYFLQKKGTDMPNRIDLLFSLIYKIHKIKDFEEERFSDILKEADNDILDTRKSVIFRYYCNMFEGKQGEELQIAVAEAWKEVMTLFRTLDDWFYTPATYNYIGLLSQCGEDITRLIYYYDHMPENATQEDFIDYLKDRIKFYLRSIKRDEEGKIVTSYKERKNIYRILLTLNIHLLNVQNSKLKSESDIYKFPFDVLNAQDWDIEHIDSFHTNALKKDELKREWIETARSDRKDFLSVQEQQEIDQKLENKEYDTVIDLLKKNAGETEMDEEIKNSIGNLTLLDAETNRSYGNSLFCTKRRIIIDRIKQGVFIPAATQYIFSKFYDDKGTNRSIWAEEDMESYHKYIICMLNEYLPEYNQ